MLHSLTSLKPVTDRFNSSNLDNTLLLKACGFIESHHARILNVTTGELKLRIGHGSLTRWLYQCTVNHKPVKVVLAFDENSTVNQAPQVRHAAINVSITPTGLGWTHQEFQETARKLLWSLRYHFMAC